MSQSSDPADPTPARREGSTPATGAAESSAKQNPTAAPEAKPAPAERPFTAAGPGAKPAAVAQIKVEPKPRVAQVGTPRPAATAPLQAKAAVATPVAKPAAAVPAKPAVAKPAIVKSVPPAPPATDVRPPAAFAQPQKRHWMLLISFVLIVIIPTLVSAWYLWAKATDQYVSATAFSIRKEDATPQVDLLGGLAALGGGASGGSDLDILYQYIRSPDMVEVIDQKLDLRSKFSLQWPNDFVFAYNPDGTIEDLTDYWQRQVQVYTDTTTGLVSINVNAFTAQDAQEIAAAILDQSTDKINEISAVARADSMRLAERELEKARVMLTEARQGMTAFRMRTQIVDPQADLAGQMGVLNGLQAQLAEQLVQHDLLLENARPSDNRVIQSQKKIDALQSLIEKERSKFGAEGHGPGGESYAQLMSEYEKLAVDREFAEGAYQSARISYEAAMAEAQRQSRYLAVHISPRVAEASTQPDRPRLLALIAGLLLIGWSIMTLIYYSVRDRG